MSKITIHFEPNSEEMYVTIGNLLGSFKYVC